MGRITDAAIFLMVIFHVGYTNDEAVDHHCECFTCSDFSNQTLVIKKDVTAGPYCMINKNTPIGEDVSCVSKATATLLTPFYLLVQSPRGENSSLILEYGRDHEPGKICPSKKAACPTPPPTSVTSNDTLKDYKTTLVIVLGVIVICLVLAGLVVLKCVSKKMYFPVAKEQQNPVPQVDAISPV